MAATEGAHSQALDSLIEAVSGSVGGFISASSLLPLDVVKTRMQAGAKGSYLMILQSVISEKGFIGLYKGFQYVGFSSAYEKFMYFYIYSFWREVFQRRFGPIDPITNLILGYVSEWGHKPFTFPSDTITTIVKSTGVSGIEAFHRVKQDGFMAFYRGLSAHTLGAWKPAVQYAVYEQIKRRTLSGQTEALSAAQAFVLGAIARGTADIIMYPARTVKTRKQTALKLSKSGTPTAEEVAETERVVSMSAFALLLHIYKIEGAASIYRGVEMEVGRGVLSAGLMLMIKERLYQLVKAFMLSTLGAKK